MDYIFLTGIIGSIVLVTGAAMPEKATKKHPVKSFKNWLFAVGGIIMFAYAILNFLDGGPIFFIFLQILVAVATVLMMIDISDVIDAIILTISGIALIIWSLTLFEGINTVFFVVGLTGIGLGYAFKVGSIRRVLSLTLGSALIAIFSFVDRKV